MKNLIFVVFIISLNSCYQAIEDFPQDEKQIKSDINQLMDEWHSNAAKADYKNYMSAMHSNSVFIGTDISENWDKKAFKDFSKPIFKKGKAWEFQALERNIYLSNEGNVAWFDEILTTWMGICRGSGVLVKTGNNWKIRHYVLSVAIPNDTVQEVIQLKSKHDSIFMSRFNIRK